MLCVIDLSHGGDNFWELASVSENKIFEVKSIILMEQTAMTKTNATCNIYIVIFIVQSAYTLPSLDASLFDLNKMWLKCTSSYFKLFCIFRVVRVESQIAWIPSDDPQKHYQNQWTTIRSAVSKLWIRMCNPSNLSLILIHFQHCHHWHVNRYVPVPLEICWFNDKKQRVMWRIKMQK